MRINPKHLILVTGAGGYIGSVTVRALLERGYKVRALDTFYWGTYPLKPVSNDIQIVKEDIRNVKPSIVKDVKTVIHTAGLSNDPMADFNPKANFEINTVATSRFAQICKKNGVKKFIFASSASIYDRKNGNSFLQDEQSEVNPTAAYSLSKLKAEKSLIKLKDKEFCLVIFRQGTVYGYSPRLRYDLVVNTMVKDALQANSINVFCKGKQWRPLVDVEDVARAYISAIELDNDHICGQVFNLHYKNFTMIELAMSIKKVLKSKFNREIKINIDNSPKIGRNYKMDGAKLRKVFKWQPTVSIEASVQNLVKSILSNKHTDFNNPKYYNIEWMKLLIDTQEILKNTSRIF